MGPNVSLNYLLSRVNINDVWELDSALETNMFEIEMLSKTRVLAVYEKISLFVALPANIHHKNSSEFKAKMCDFLRKNCGSIHSDVHRTRTANGKIENIALCLHERERS